MELALNYLNTIAIALLSLIFYCLFLYRFSKGKEAPIVAGAWPILGHLKLLSASNTSYKTLGALADKYGPLFTIKLGLKPALVLSNWEMAKQCFTTNDVAVSSRPKLVAVEVMSYNQAFVGLAPYGTYWRELRKIVTVEFLSNRRIEQLRHIRVSEVQASFKELVNLWSSKKYVSDYALVDMKQWFANLTFNMVIRMVVGKRYLFNDIDNVGSGDEAKRIMNNIREFMKLMGTFTVADGVPFLRWLDLGGYEKAMKETAKKFDEVLSEWLEEHRQKKALGGKVESEKDFMDVMLSALNDSKIDGYDADTICKATTLELILGGTDSTAITLTWALCLLLRNPQVLEKAKEEINTHIDKEEFISESHINKLVYLQAIVKETLRLYPPAPLSSPREFIENCTLGGYHIKKGTRLIPNLWKIHRDPSVWSDPLEFKPERFLTTHKDVDVRGQHFELLPFGSGRRICAGMSLGMNMVQFTLANFLHSFEVMNPLNEPIDMTEFFGFTNTKATPLEILVKPRLPPSYYETL